MAITLGRPPDSLSVVLSRGGAFVTALQAPDGWPDGTVIELHFQVSDTATPIVWPATIAGDLASWERGPDDVAEVLDTRALDTRMIYGSATLAYPFVWAKGRAVVD